MFGNHPARGTWTPLPDNVFISTASNYHGGFQENYFTHSHQITPNESFHIKDTEVASTGMTYEIKTGIDSEVGLPSWLDINPVFLSYSDSRLGTTEREGWHSHTIYSASSSGTSRSAFESVMASSTAISTSESGGHDHEFSYDLSHGHSLFKEDLGHYHILPDFSATINSDPTQLTHLGIVNIGIRAFMRTA